MSGTREDAVTPVSILLEQYKIAEARRMEFGRQFMQTAGFVTAVFAGAVAVAGVRNPDLLRGLVGVGGIFFLCTGYLGYRLGKRQNDCEDTLREVEDALRAAGYLGIASLRPGARLGARSVLVAFMAGLGVSLLTGAVMWR